MAFTALLASGENVAQAINPATGIAVVQVLHRGRVPAEVVDDREDYAACSRRNCLVRQHLIKPWYVAARALVTCNIHSPSHVAVAVGEKGLMKLSFVS